MTHAVLQVPEVRAGHSDRADAWRVAIRFQFPPHSSGRAAGREAADEPLAKVLDL